MRLFSRYHLLVLVVAAPLLAEVALWIKSYFGNDYIFCRWLKVTDENGKSADLKSRTAKEWLKHPGSKFQTRYIAVASRGGGVCFGLVLGRYVVTEDLPGMLRMLLLLQLQRNQERGMFGTGHSSSTEYFLTEENLKYGFGQQKHLYTSPGEEDFAYREHWAVVIPHWFVFLLMLFPTIRLIPRFARRARWHARGYCLKCGYDLRATPGQCPECGPSKPGKSQ
jgi:hypothetical protein